jgi:hypothetical protein
LSNLFAALAVILPFQLPWSVPAEPSFPITILGGGSGSFLPAPPEGPAVPDPGLYDAVVVGAGPAGLTAAFRLSGKGRTVLLLEKEEQLGGLAAGSVLKNGIQYSRGVGYWGGALPAEAGILKEIGLGDYKKKYAIPEPDDSYLWNGKLYTGIWEKETLSELPASFALFKHELLMADWDDMIPDQPFEEWKDLELDGLSAAEWIRSMPAEAAGRRDPGGRAVWRRFQKDPPSPSADPMRDVVDFMDLYCRAALGDTSDQISAAVFANFYIAELKPRYTAPLGAGEISSRLEKFLVRRGRLVSIRRKATVVKLENSGRGVRVTYEYQGKLRQALAKYAVFAAQLKFAPKIIPDLSGREPERAAAIAGLRYANYLVHVVFVKGHPYRASYDTWVRAADYGRRDFTDIVLGRWMDPSIRGYEGMRDFKKTPPDERGILTIYQPFVHPSGIPYLSAGLERLHVTQVARRAVRRMLEIYSPVLRERWGTKIEVESVETSRWPYSMHVAGPGHITRLGKVLRKPFGRIFFASSNIGAPSSEEAIFRGYCAADNILKRLDGKFRREPRANCPME